MACNCIEEVTQKIKGKVSVNNPEWKEREITEVHLENVCWMLDGTGTRVYSPTVIDYDCKNKKGETTHKKESVNMNYTFCPFCGKRYKEK